VIARVLAACLLLALAGAAARAQAPQPTYVQFEPVGVKGALYRPDPGRERDVGVLVIHRVNNFLGHLAAWQLAELLSGCRRAGSHAQSRALHRVRNAERAVRQRHEELLQLRGEVDCFQILTHCQNCQDCQNCQN
jgi:hypothetical protein